jgi:hypothetical protein
MNSKVQQINIENTALESTVQEAVTKNAPEGQTVKEWEVMLRCDGVHLLGAEAG